MVHNVGHPGPLRIGRSGALPRAPCRRPRRDPGGFSGADAVPELPDDAGMSRRRMHAIRDRCVLAAVRPRQSGRPSYRHPALSRFVRRTGSRSRLDVLRGTGPFTMRALDGP
jgi:hypothetical protein